MLHVGLVKICWILYRSNIPIFENFRAIAKLREHLILQSIFLIFLWDGHPARGVFNLDVIA